SSGAAGTPAVAPDGREGSEAADLAAFELAQAQVGSPTGQGDGANGAQASPPPQEGAPKETATEGAAADAASVIRVAIGGDGVARLPENTALNNIRIVGADIHLVQPDGTVIVIENGAIRIPTLLMGSVEIPAE